MVSILKLACLFCKAKYGANGMWRHHKRAHGEFDYPIEEMHDQLFWSDITLAEGLDCWRWTGWIDAGGYGVFTVKGKAHKAHRHSYEKLIGPIPRGLVLDHLCRVRNCVNPYHLDPVTIAVNTARGLGNSTRVLRTHCRQGHKYTPENAYVEISANGGVVRHCVICRNRNTAAANARKLAAKEMIRDGADWWRSASNSSVGPIAMGDVLESATTSATVTRVSRAHEWADIRIMDATDSERPGRVRIRLPLANSSVDMRVGVSK